TGERINKRMSNKVEAIIKQQWKRRNAPHPSDREEARSILSTHIGLLRELRKNELRENLVFRGFLLNG
ncbi:MAG: hypothetical protein AAF226_17765, partial [Verrucomicrobiota bacterium]